MLGVRPLPLASMYGVFTYMDFRSRNGPPKPDDSFYMGPTMGWIEGFFWIQLMEPLFGGSAGDLCIESTVWLGVGFKDFFF